jgi:hypothetical protein
VDNDFSIPTGFQSKNMTRTLPSSFYKTSSAPPASLSRAATFNVPRYGPGQSNVNSTYNNRYGNAGSTDSSSSKSIIGGVDNRVTANGLSQGFSQRPQGFGSRYNMMPSNQFGVPTPAAHIPLTEPPKRPTQSTSTEGEKKVELSDEQKAVLDYILMHRENVFYTGSAGK